jgi:non-specific serine/threonine protein kinase
LLHNPGQAFHVLDLLSAVGLVPARQAPPVAQPLVDVTAKAAYRDRLMQLRAELEEAERFNDLLRATRAREEIDFLTRHLAAAVGLGGRNRRPTSDSERARVAVTLRIKAAVKKIREGNASLGHHLATCIKTGRFCVYLRDPTRPVSWSFLS